MRTWYLGLFFVSSGPLSMAWSVCYRYDSRYIIIRLLSCRFVELKHAARHDVVPYRVYR